MPKLALSPVNEPNSPILIVSWENAEPATARMTPKTRRNRRFIISAGLLAIGGKTARAMNVWRFAFTVHRSPFTVQRVWRLAFGVWPRRGGRSVPLCSFNTGQTDTVRLLERTFALAFLELRPATPNGER